MVEIFCPMNRFLKTVLFFGVLIAVLYASLNPVEYFSCRPQGDHAWAQCDRASVALNYFQYAYPFFEPHTHNVAYNPSGIAAGEFPLIPFLVSKLYGYFGFHEYIYRIFTLFFSLVGFFTVFMISRIFLSRIIFQISASVFWILSPNLIYYSTGFLPDSVSLSFFAIAVYFLVYQEVISVKNILLFSLFSSIAVLLKSSVLFLVVAIGFALLVTTYKIGESKRILLRFISLIIPFLFCLSWIIYARHSQQLYHSNIFKLGLLLPNTFQDLLDSGIRLAVNLPKFYPLPILFLICFSLAFLVRNFQSANLLHVFTLSAFAMWALFFVVMMRNASHHGYYHIPFQIAISTLFISAAGIAEQKEWNLKGIHFISIGLFTFCSWGLYATTIHKISSHQEFINSQWKTLEPVLRNAGIKNTDRVFSAVDPSYNISLYFMNQRGWTCPEKVWDSYKIDALSDCQYAVFTDTTIAREPIIEKYLTTEIAAYGPLHIYKLKH